MNDFGRYCKNRIKYSFYRFLFILLIGSILFVLSEKLDLFETKVYALENKTIYGSYENNQMGNPSKFSGLSNTNGGEQAYNVGQTYTNAIYGIRFGIQQNITSGQSYHMKINFNDYDVRNPVDYSYINLSLNTCTITSFNLENKNSSGNARTIDFKFYCLMPSSNLWIAIQKYNNGYYYVTTGNWQLNSVAIEVDNSGTQDIINNNNTNTQTIIDNQNDIAEQQHQDQIVCNNIDKTNIEIDNKYLDNNGNQQPSNNYGITEYIKINSNSTIKVLTSLNSDSAKYCFYNVNKELISCGIISTSLANTSLTIPTNSSYFRSSIQKTQNKPTFEICINGNQAIADTNKSIWQSILDLPTTLSNMFTNLLVPTSQQMQPILEELKDWIELKFGVLGQLLSITIDFIEKFYLLDDSQDVIIHIPEITIPNFEEETPIIEEQYFNWTDLLEEKESIYTLWIFYLDFIDVIIIIAFLNLCENIYEDIMEERHLEGNNIYESEGESYSVNDRTGELTDHRYWTKRSRRA